MIYFYLSSEQRNKEPKYLRQSSDRPCKVQCLFRVAVALNKHGGNSEPLLLLQDIHFVWLFQPQVNSVFAVDFSYPYA